MCRFVANSTMAAENGVTVLSTSDADADFARLLVSGTPESVASVLEQLWLVPASDWHSFQAASQRVRVRTWLVHRETGDVSHESASASTFAVVDAQNDAPVVQAGVETSGLSDMDVALLLDDAVAGVAVENVESGEDYDALYRVNVSLSASVGGAAHLAVPESAGVAVTATATRVQLHGSLAAINAALRAAGVVSSSTAVSNATLSLVAEDAQLATGDDNVVLSPQNTSAVLGSFDPKLVLVDDPSSFSQVVLVLETADRRRINGTAVEFATEGVLPTLVSVPDQAGLVVIGNGTAVVRVIISNASADVASNVTVLLSADSSWDSRCFGSTAVVASIGGAQVASLVVSVVGENDLAGVLVAPASVSISAGQFVELGLAMSVSLDDVLADCPLSWDGVEVALSVANGSVRLNDSAGVTFLQPAERALGQLGSEANAFGQFVVHPAADELWFFGAVETVNAALVDLEYRPSATAVSTEVLSVRVRPLVGTPDAVNGSWVNTSVQIHSDSAGEHSVGLVDPSTLTVLGSEDTASTVGVALQTASGQMNASRVLNVTVLAGGGFSFSFFVLA